LIDIEISIGRRCAAPVQDRLGACELRAKSCPSLFIDHAMRFGSAQLAGGGKQCPGRHDIVNGETELPQIGRRFPAQSEAFEQEFWSQFELHRFHPATLDRRITSHGLCGSVRSIFARAARKIFSLSALARARIIVAKTHAPIVSRF
jgi:hypothetical protein